MNPTNQRAYQAMCKEAERLNIMTAYHADLYVHDKAALSIAPAPMKFAWGICSTGTHILKPGPKREYTSGSLRALSSWHTPIHWYWWNLLKLKRVTHEDLEQMLGEGYFDGEPVLFDVKQYDAFEEQYRAEYNATISTTRTTTTSMEATA